LVPPGDQKERRATPLHALPEMVTADALGNVNYVGVVVQLVRIPACRAGGCGFESRPPRIAPVTQWIEYRISNPAVAGSSPARRVRL
jgi:hypothetical protein